MKVNQIKVMAMALILLPLLALTFFNSDPTRAVSLSPDDEAETIYKTKCAVCHGPTAAKFYDPEAPEAEQVEAILKGKKGEKPPFMPAYENKGIDEAMAKALVCHMKKLRNPDAE